MRDGFFIIDGDGHVHENEQAIRGHMEPQFRTRPLSGGAFVDRSVGGKFGQRGGGPDVQLADMDTEGIDVAVLYPTALLGAWGLRES